jgi:hypothetical protein
MNGLVSGYGTDSDGEDAENESFPTSTTTVVDKNKAESLPSNDGELSSIFNMILIWS